MTYTPLPADGDMGGGMSGATGGSAGGGSIGMGAGAAMGLQGIGGLFGAYASYEAGHANGAVMRFNADYERQLAHQSMESGEFNAALTDLKGANLAGQQASSAAGQGVVAGAGSAGSNVSTSNAMSETDKMMIRLNARRQAYGHEIAAESDQTAGDNAIRQGNMGAVSSVLGSAGNIASFAALL
jgi:hypothetical protein